MKTTSYRKWSREATHWDASWTAGYVSAARYHGGGRHEGAASDKVYIPGIPGASFAEAVNTVGTSYSNYLSPAPRDFFIGGTRKLKKNLKGKDLRVPRNGNGHGYKYSCPSGSESCGTHGVFTYGMGANNEGGRYNVRFVAEGFLRVPDELRGEGFAPLPAACATLGGGRNDFECHALKLSKASHVRRSSGY